MWPDPTDTSLRKPRRLKGTPANRFFSKIVIGTLIGGYIISYLWSIRPSQLRRIEAQEEILNYNSDSALAESILRNAPNLRKKMEDTTETFN